jgi:hypothetical protein
MSRPYNDKPTALEWIIAGMISVGLIVGMLLSDRHTIVFVGITITSYFLMSFPMGFIGFIWPKWFEKKLDIMAGTALILSLLLATGVIVMEINNPWLIPIIYGTSS